MTEAESTVKYAIFDAIVNRWHRKGETSWASDVRNDIFDKIFEPHLRWALKEHLDTLENKKEKPINEARQNKNKP